MASGFVWYEHMTNDMDAAVAFYSKVVAWDIRDSGMPGPQYMIFSMDGKDVGGMMSWTSMGKTGMPSVWKAHIYTPDVDAETKAVVADGGKQYMAPQDIPGVGRFSVVCDPQGAEFLLFQPNQEYAPPRLAQNEVGGVGWHELMTTDLDKALAFYMKHYGWEKDRATDMGEMGIYQTFRMGGQEHYGGGMMKVPPFMAGTQPGWLYYFTVADVDAAAEVVKAAGGTITHGPADVPGGSRIVQALDPQGGKFALVSTTS
jgi:predicted enzyme related to lactoylglutathione lyase